MSAAAASSSRALAHLYPVSSIPNPDIQSVTLTPDGSSLFFTQSDSLGQATRIVQFPLNPPVNANPNSNPFTPTNVQLGDLNIIWIVSIVTKLETLKNGDTVPLLYLLDRSTRMITRFNLKSGSIDLTAMLLSPPTPSTIDTVSLLASSTSATSSSSVYAFSTTALWRFDPNINTPIARIAAIYTLPTPLTCVTIDQSETYGYGIPVGGGKVVRFALPTLSSTATAGGGSGTAIPSLSWTVLYNTGGLISTGATDITVDTTGTYLYVTDNVNGLIRINILSGSASAVSLVSSTSSPPSPPLTFLRFPSPSFTSSPFTPPYGLTVPPASASSTAPSIVVFGTTITPVDRIPLTAKALPKSLGNVGSSGGQSLQLGAWFVDDRYKIMYFATPSSETGVNTFYSVDVTDSGTGQTATAYQLPLSPLSTPILGISLITIATRSFPSSTSSTPSPPSPYHLYFITSLFDIFRFNLDDPLFDVAISGTDNAYQPIDLVVDSNEKYLYFIQSNQMYVVRCNIGGGFVGENFSAASDCAIYSSNIGNIVAIAMDHTNSYLYILTNAPSSSSSLPTSSTASTGLYRIPISSFTSSLVSASLIYSGSLLTSPLDLLVSDNESPSVVYVVDAPDVDDGGLNQIVRIEVESGRARNVQVVNNGMRWNQRGKGYNHLQFISSSPSSLTSSSSPCTFYASTSSSTLSVVSIDSNQGIFSETSTTNGVVQPAILTHGASSLNLAHIQAMELDDKYLYLTASADDQSYQISYIALNALASASLPSSSSSGSATIVNQLPTPSCSFSSPQGISLYRPSVSSPLTTHILLVDPSPSSTTSFARVAISNGQCDQIISSATIVTPNPLPVPDLLFQTRRIQAPVDIVSNPTDNNKVYIADKVAQDVFECVIDPLNQSASIPICNPVASQIGVPIAVSIDSSATYLYTLTSSQSSSLSSIPPLLWQTNISTGQTIALYSRSGLGLNQPIDVFVTQQNVIWIVDQQIGVLKISSTNSSNTGQELVGEDDDQMQVLNVKVSTTELNTIRVNADGAVYLGQTSGLYTLGFAATPSYSTVYQLSPPAATTALTTSITTFDCTIATCFPSLPTSFSISPSSFTLAPTFMYLSFGNVIQRLDIHNPIIQAVPLLYDQINSPLTSISSIAIMSSGDLIITDRNGYLARYLSSASAPIPNIDIVVDSFLISPRDVVLTNDGLYAYIIDDYQQQVIGCDLTAKNTCKAVSGSVGEVAAIVLQNAAVTTSSSTTVIAYVVTNQATSTNPIGVYSISLSDSSSIPTLIYSGALIQSPVDIELASIASSILYVTDEKTGLVIIDTITGSVSRLNDNDTRSLGNQLIGIKQSNQLLYGIDNQGILKSFKINTILNTISTLIVPTPNLLVPTSLPFLLPLSSAYTFLTLPPPSSISPLGYISTSNSLIQYNVQSQLSSFVSIAPSADPDLQFTSISRIRTDPTGQFIYVIDSKLNDFVRVSISENGENVIGILDRKSASEEKRNVIDVAITSSSSNIVYSLSSYPSSSLFSCNVSPSVVISPSSSTSSASQYQCSTLCSNLGSPISLSINSAESRAYVLTNHAIGDVGVGIWEVVLNSNKQGMANMIYGGGSNEIGVLKVPKELVLISDSKNNNQTQYFVVYDSILGLVRLHAVLAEDGVSVLKIDEAIVLPMITISGNLLQPSPSIQFDSRGNLYYLSSSSSASSPSSLAIYSSYQTITSSGTPPSSTPFTPTPIDDSTFLSLILAFIFLFVTVGLLVLLIHYGYRKWKMFGTGGVVNAHETVKQRQRNQKKRGSQFQESAFILNGGGRRGSMSSTAGGNDQRRKVSMSPNLTHSRNSSLPSNLNSRRDSNHSSGGPDSRRSSFQALALDGSGVGGLQSVDYSPEELAAIAGMAKAAGSGGSGSNTPTGNDMIELQEVNISEVTQRDLPRHGRFGSNERMFTSPATIAINPTAASFSGSSSPSSSAAPEFTFVVAPDDDADARVAGAELAAATGLAQPNDQTLGLDRDIIQRSRNRSSSISTLGVDMVELEEAGLMVEQGMEIEKKKKGLLQMLSPIRNKYETMD